MADSLYTFSSYSDDFLRSNKKMQHLQAMKRHFEKTFSRLEKKYIYQFYKDESIFLYATHPGLKQEFQYIKNDLLQEWNASAPPERISNLVLTKGNIFSELQSRSVQPVPLKPKKAGSDALPESLKNLGDEKLKESMTAFYKTWQTVKHFDPLDEKNYEAVYVEVRNRQKVLERKDSRRYYPAYGAYSEALYL